MATFVELSTKAKMPIVGLGTWQVNMLLSGPLSIWKDLGLFFFRVFLSLSLSLSLSFLSLFTFSVPPPGHGAG